MKNYVCGTCGKVLEAKDKYALARKLKNRIDFGVDIDDFEEEKNKDVLNIISKCDECYVWKPNFSINLSRCEFKKS